MEDPVTIGSDLPEGARTARFSDLARLAGRLSHEQDPQRVLPALAREARRLLECRYTAIVIRDADGVLTWFIPAGPRADEIDGSVPTVIADLERIVVSSDRGSALPGVLRVELSAGARAIGEIYATGKDEFDAVDRSTLVSIAAFIVEAIELSGARERERQASAELENLRTLEEEFVAAISHEVRTPLTIINGYAKTLELRLDSMSPDDIRDAARGLAEGARRLDGILTEVLDFDRLRRRAVEAHKIPTRVDGLVRMMIAESECLGRRVMHVRTEPVTASVDPPKVERIVDALLANIERHTPPGSPVWISVVPNDDGVLITVEDEGPGIPADLALEVLRPFRHARNGAPEPGAGLGLPIAAEYVRLHGGRLNIDERPDGGTRVSVWFPAD